MPRGMRDHPLQVDVLNATPGIFSVLRGELTIRLRLHASSLSAKSKIGCDPLGRKVSNPYAPGRRRSRPKPQRSGVSTSSCEGDLLYLREVKEAIRESLECNRTSAPEEGAIDLRLQPLLQLLAF